MILYFYFKIQVSKNLNYKLIFAYKHIYCNYYNNNSYNSVGYKKILI